MNKSVEQHDTGKHRRHLRKGSSLKPNMDELMCTTCRGGDCDPQCPSYDLCKKRVLIVGGIERMEKAYRKLVEEHGGIFEYHAGHMKSGGKGLENRFIRLERTFDKMKGHGAQQVFTPMKTKRMNRHVHELFVPCVRAAWL